jgi:hypothetical protein
MKTIFAILMILSVGLCAIAQESAADNKTGNEVIGPSLAGSGTINHIPLWLSSTQLGNSKIVQKSGNVGIGTTSPIAPLDVAGSVNTSTSYTIGGYPVAFGSPNGGTVLLGFAGNSLIPTAGGNTAVGSAALYSDVGDTAGDGSFNTAVGYGSLHSNNDTSQTGPLAADNTASGAYTLFSNSTGSQNTASGYMALYKNSTGGYNVATGAYALWASQTGQMNTATGYATLQSNTVGFQNTATGAGALSLNNTGFNNTATGDSALAFNTSGEWNTADGVSALASNTTGSYNTALGYGAGPDSNSTNLTNSTAIGANAVVSESNALVLGGSGGWAVKVGIGTARPTNVFTVAQGAGQAIADGWTTYSSRRWKTNIHPLHAALAKVEQLRGVSYDLKDSGKHEIGVIAEEVGEVVPEVVTYDNNGTGAQAVDYGRLTALLIEATKEQQALIEKQQRQIRTQQTQIAHLSSQVKTIQATLKLAGANPATLNSTNPARPAQPTQK